jgi:DNA repair exonuclease SbcCD ATPase subunit
MSTDSKNTVSIDALERLGRTIKNIGLAVADTQEQLAESNQDRKKEREQIDKLAATAAKMETQIEFLLESDRRVEQIPAQLAQIQADQERFQDQLNRLEETVKRLIASQGQKEEEAKKEKKELSTARINARNGLAVALVGGSVTLLIQLATVFEQHLLPSPTPSAEEREIRSQVKDQVTPSQPRTK